MQASTFILLDRRTPLVVVSVDMLVYQPRPLSFPLFADSVIHIIQKELGAEEEENRTRTRKEPHFTLWSADSFFPSSSIRAGSLTPAPTETFQQRQVPGPVEDWSPLQLVRGGVLPEPLLPTRTGERKQRGTQVANCTNTVGALRLTGWICRH